MVNAGLALDFVDYICLWIRIYIFKEVNYTIYLRYDRECVYFEKTKYTTAKHYSIYYMYRAMINARKEAAEEYEKGPLKSHTRIKIENKTKNRITII